MSERFNATVNSATLLLPKNNYSGGSEACVRDYIKSHNLEAAVEKTINLAQAELPSGSRTELFLSNDGESEDTWLLIHLIVNAPRNQLFDLYDRFMDIWVESIPSAMQHRIHITYGT